VAVRNYCSLISRPTAKSLRRNTCPSALCRLPANGNSIDNSLSCASLYRYPPLHANFMDFRNNTSCCICSVSAPYIPLTSKWNAHTHPFNSPFSGTTRVSWHQKGKTNLDFTEARDSEWQCHQLGHMQVCTSLQTDNHASTSPLSFLQAGCPSCRPTTSKH